LDLRVGDQTLAPLLHQTSKADEGRISHACISLRIQCAFCFVSSDSKITSVTSNLLRLMRKRNLTMRAIVYAVQTKDMRCASTQRRPGEGALSGRCHHHLLLHVSCSISKIIIL
jgi:hypothetical protein